LDNPPRSHASSPLRPLEARATTRAAARRADRRDPGAARAGTLAAVKLAQHFFPGGWVMVDWKKLEGSANNKGKPDIDMRQADLAAALTVWAATLQCFDASSKPEDVDALAVHVRKWMEDRLQDVTFAVDSKGGVQFRGGVYQVTVTVNAKQANPADRFKLGHAAAYLPKQATSAHLGSKAHAEEAWYKAASANLGGKPVFKKDTLTFTCVVGYVSTAPCTDHCAWSFQALAWEIGAPILVYSGTDYGYLKKGGPPGPVLLFSPLDNAALIVGQMDNQDAITWLHPDAKDDGDQKGGDDDKNKSGGKGKNKHGKAKSCNDDNWNDNNWNNNNCDNKSAKENTEVLVEWILKLFASLQKNNNHQDANHFLKGIKKTYEVHDVAADGNCLFRAISLAVSGTEDEHGQHRIDAVTYMVGHGQTFHDLDEDGKHDSVYLAIMRAPANSAQDRQRWGGFPEIYALSQVLRRRIVVHAPGFADNKITIPDDGAFVPNGSDIHLAFTGSNHYKYLEPKQ
jgi:hypothetical protein